MHVPADSASGRLPAAQAQGREPALYSGLGHVHTRSPDTRPCVTHAIQTNACDDKRDSKCHVNNVGDTCEEKGSKRMENNCIVEGK